MNVVRVTRERLGGRSWAIVEKRDDVTVLAVDAAGERVARAVLLQLEQAPDRT